jgi:predicted nuclease of predicted toxin-antitoxin system
MGSVGFFFDENLPPQIARALAQVELPVFNAHDEQLRQTPDPILFQHCRERGLVFVTKDRRIHKNPAERLALAEAQITVINIEPSKGTQLRPLFALIVRHLDSTERTLVDRSQEIYVMRPKSFHSLAEEQSRAGRRS